MARTRQAQAQPGGPFAARYRDLVRVVPRAAQAPFLDVDKSEHARLAQGPLRHGEADAGERCDMAEGERAGAALPASSAMTARTACSPPVKAAASTSGSPTATHPLTCDGARQIVRSAKPWEA